MNFFFPLPKTDCAHFLPSLSGDHYSSIEKKHPQNPKKIITIGFDGVSIFLNSQSEAFGFNRENSTSLTSLVALLEAFGLDRADSISPISYREVFGSDREVSILSISLLKAFGFDRDDVADFNPSRIQKSTPIIQTVLRLSFREE